MGRVSAGHRRGRTAVSGAAGVTFAEVAATLLVLSVLMLVMVPILSQLLGMYHLRGATEEIYAELQRSRLAAVMENNQYRFYVVDGSDRYKIHDDRNNDGVEDTGEVTSRTVELENPGIILAGNDTVTFLPNGTALTYGTFTVMNGSGRSKQVIVSSGGRIRIQ